MMSAALPTAVTTRRVERIQMSTGFLPNACTELMRPVRVVHVARMVKKKVTAASPSAQRLNRPRAL